MNLDRRARQDIVDTQFTPQSKQVSGHRRDSFSRGFRDGARKGIWGDDRAVDAPNHGVSGPINASVMPAMEESRQMEETMDQVSSLLFISFSQ